MKDLGVVVADTLTWATHSQSRTQKALNALYSIKRNPSLANYANRKNSYVSYIAPIISYGSSVCGNQAKLNSVKLKVFRKKQQIGSLEPKLLTKNNS